jgi:inorganic pyrophosphatase/exopolyphosphatase
MTHRSQFFLFIVLISCCANAQYKVFSYNQIQSRNDIQEWGKSETITTQKAEFTADQINLKIDKNYHLTIVSKTDLPDRGTIYLCKDEKSNPITIMLFDNIKMYLYAQTKRFLINFQHTTNLNQLADSD